MRKLEEWIEYIEDDIDLLSRSKLELLLEHSPENRVVHNNMCRLRRILKDTDPAKEIEPVLENAQFMNAFYGRIVKGINEIARDHARSKRVTRRRDRKLSQVTCKR